MPVNGCNATTSLQQLHNKSSLQCRYWVETDTRKDKKANIAVYFAKEQFCLDVWMRISLSLNVLLLNV